MRRKVFALQAVLAAVWLAFHAISAWAGNFVEPGAGLDVQYATQPDGTLLLTPPGSLLDEVLYRELFGATSTNNTLAWKILYAAMTARHATAGYLAERDQGCRGLDQFARRDYVARITPLYEAELRRATRFNAVRLIEICENPGPYDFTKEGFILNAKFYDLFAEGKQYELPFVPIPEDVGHAVLQKQAAAFNQVSFRFVLIFRGNLIPPAVAVENRLLSDGLRVDVRNVEVHLMEFKKVYGRGYEDYSILQDIRVDSLSHEYKSSIGLYAGLAGSAPALAPATGGVLGDYVQVNPDQFTLWGKPDYLSARFYQNSPLDHERFNLRWACFSAVAISNSIESVKSQIARLQAVIEQQTALGAPTQQVENAVRSLHYFQTNLTKLTEPINRAQACKLLQYGLMNVLSGVRSPYLSFLFDLSAPDDIKPPLLERLKRTRADLAKEASYPNVPPAEAQRVADLNHRIENVEDLIAKGDKNDAQKELDALWEWAIHEPLPAQSASRSGAWELIHLWIGPFWPLKSTQSQPQPPIFKFELKVGACMLESHARFEHVGENQLILWRKHRNRKNTFIFSAIRRLTATAP